MPAAPRRASYRKTMQGSVAHQEAYNCIVNLITTPAPQGKGSFTIREVEHLTLIQLNKITVGLRHPWTHITLHWDWLERHIREKLSLDLIPLAEYFFSNLPKVGKSMSYDLSMGVPMNVIAFRSISCCPPTSHTVGYIANSALVHPIDAMFPLTWLEWRKAVGAGHVRNAMTRLDRSVVNKALTQAQADLVISRANFAPLRRLLK